MQTLRRTRSYMVRYTDYERCSTDDQAQGDYTTIEAQYNINRAFIDKLIAESGGNGEYIRSYQDEGRSGTHLKRKGFNELLRDAREGQFDIVVVRDTSRLGRGDAFYAAEMLLREAKVKVVYAEQNFTDDTNGRMMKRVTALADAMYVDRVSEWTVSKMSDMARLGYCTGGVRCFGYTSVPAPGMKETVTKGGKVKPPPRIRVPHPDEKHHVKGAFELMAHTNNMGAVQRFLRSVDTSRAWAMDSVRRMLTNDIYRGIARWNKGTANEIVNPAAHEALIPEQLWDVVHVLMEERLNREPLTGGEGRNNGYNKPHRIDKFVYYLRGKVFCAHCGTRMTPAGHHGKTSKVCYYQCCRNNRTTDATKCPVRTVNADALHQVVLGEIARAGQHPTRLQAFITHAVRSLPSSDSLRQKLKMVAKRHSDVETNLRTNQAAMEASQKRGKPFDTFLNRIWELEEELGKLQQERARLEQESVSLSGSRPDANRIASVWSRFMELWQDFTEEERTEVLSLMVEHVVISEKDKESRKVKGTMRLNLTSSLLQVRNFAIHGCGGKTRTCDLWVMSPTSYRLLHPAS